MPSPPAEIRRCDLANATLVNTRRGAAGFNQFTPRRCECAALPVLSAPRAHLGPAQGHTGPIPPPETGEIPGISSKPSQALLWALASLPCWLRAILKCAWLNSIPDPSWNLRAGKAESSHCSSAQRQSGGRQRLWERKELQKPAQERLTGISVLRVGTDFVPGTQPHGAAGCPGRSGERRRGEKTPGTAEGPGAALLLLAPEKAFTQVVHR